jgi:uncharacterized oxidoreductase
MNACFFIAVLFILAGLHSFTLSLRHQLKDTSIKVVEIVPPGVETDLSAGASFSKIGVNEYGDDTIRQLLEGITEIGYNNDDPKILRASRDELDVWFKSFN